MILVYVCLGVCILASVFLWLTALSGTKFYEVFMSRRDISVIKWIIHFALVAFFIGLSYLVYVYRGSEDVQAVESSTQTEEVQGDSSEAERGREW